MAFRGGGSDCSGEVTQCVDLAVWISKCGTVWEERVDGVEM